MLRRVTLTAESQLIATARKKAAESGTTINAEFRKWLATFVATKPSKKVHLGRLEALFEATSGAAIGRHRVSRQEMNERGFPIARRRTYD